MATETPHQTSPVSSTLLDNPTSDPDADDTMHTAYNRMDSNVSDDASESLLQPGVYVDQLASEIQGELTKIDIMSSGAFADVWLGTWTPPDGETVDVAIKYLRDVKMAKIKTNVEAKRKRIDIRMKREAIVWQKSTHRHILRFHGFKGGRDPCLVSPWCKNGNLDDYIKANPDLPEVEKLSLLHQAAQAIDYLHSLAPPISHGDIKPNNVMIDDNNEAAVCDFGLARVVDGLDMHTGLSTSTQGQNGTKGYIAQELLAEEDVRPSTASDVFAFGGLILSVMSGITPYGSMSDAKALMMVVIGTLPSPADHPLIPADASLWDLMRRCWEFEPNSRPAMREVVEALEYEISQRKVHSA